MQVAQNYAKIMQKLYKNYAKITPKKLYKNYANVCKLHALHYYAPPTLLMQRQPLPARAAAEEIIPHRRPEGANFNLRWLANPCQCTEKLDVFAWQLVYKDLDFSDGRPHTECGVRYAESGP